LRRPGFYPPDDGTCPVWWDGRTEETVQERVEKVIESHLITLLPALAGRNQDSYVHGVFSRNKRRGWFR
jgi:hypothetical protein